MTPYVRIALLALAIAFGMAACSTDDPDAPPPPPPPIPDLPAAGADAARPAIDPRALPPQRPLLPGMPDLHGASLVITDAALAGMTAAGVPSAVTQRLQALKGRNFRNPTVFLSAVEDRIGTEALTAHRRQIVEHALNVTETGELPPPLSASDLAEAEGLSSRPAVARASVTPPPAAAAGATRPVSAAAPPLPAADRLITGKVEARKAVAQRAPPPPPPVSAPGPGLAQPRGPAVYFATEKDEVREHFMRLLDRVARDLLKKDKQQVSIEGHADRRGQDSTNQELSERRARAVRDVLSQKGVPEARMETQGFGSKRPLDAADTREAWARNRRVEIVPR